MEPDVRLLRYFLAVADEMHFGRAAQRLFITQPALSQQVRRLESQLGLELFIRDHRALRLTAAGQELRQPASDVVRAAKRFELEAGRIARPPAPRLRLGYQAQLPDALLVRAARHYRARHPDVTLEFQQVDFFDTSVGLVDGTCDVAVVSLPVKHHLAAVPLLTLPRVALLPTRHRLAARPEVTVAQLLDSGLAWGEPPSTDPVWRDFWTAAEERASRGARGAIRTLTPHNMDVLMAEIASGEMLALTFDGLVGTYAMAGIRAVPVRGLAPVTFAAARRPGDERLVVRELVEALVGEALVGEALVGEAVDHAAPPAGRGGEPSGARPALAARPGAGPGP
jgi:DNA-binding transcriptional LysR family regulator